ncbi:MAG TPA: phosphoribosylglycinamide formyltransferase [Treponemataceae bacterium]|mgnify:FL=1|nr:phosphoribosylglycinamide formyltransferase [Treponemataceae bacterium]
MKIAVLVSGGGTNLQALIDNTGKTSPEEAYEIAYVGADRDCFALERARKEGIPCGIESAPAGTPRAEARRFVSDRMLDKAKEAGADAIVLAGFLTILSGNIVDEYSERILNLHPALLPKFGGPGMWGHHVHEAVLAAGEPESGCTVHLVDSGCDTGPILLQKKVPVLPGDTAETLAKRIASHEHEAILEGVKLLAKRVNAEKARAR